MPGLMSSFKGLIRPTGVSLNANSISVEESHTYQLIATVSPNNARNKKVTRTSSDTSVATVNNNGLVTAISVGNCIITAKTNDKGFVQECECEVWVVPITGFELNKSSTTIIYQNTEQLTLTITPNNATYQGVTRGSSNTSICTVTQTGLVRAVGEGNCTITCISEDGIHSASCAVTAELIHVTGVSLNKNSIELAGGETSQLTATITPSNATIKTVTWSSSNTSIATVSSSGLVTYKSDGTCTITCTTTDGGYTATCSVLCEDIKPVSQTFTYTGADQSYTIPYTQCYKLEARGGGSYDAAGGYASGVTCLTKGTVLRIMVGAKGNNGGTIYGFGGSSNYNNSYNGAGLSGIFTGSTAIGASDSSRALVIGGGAGSCSGRGNGGAGGGECGASGGTSGYGTQGGGGTQTGRQSGGNVGKAQFCGGGGSGKYGAGGGGGWYGGNGTAGDSSAWDDRGAGGGSGYVKSGFTSCCLTTGGGSAAQTHGCVKISSI